MYWILFIGIAVISYIVQNSLQSKFKKYSKMPLASGMTGKDVAEKMLHDNGISLPHSGKSPSGDSTTCCRA